MKHLLTLVTLALLCGCENPVEHFTERPRKQREYIIPADCIQTIDSITVDDTGRETTYHSCTVGEP